MEKTIWEILHLDTPTNSIEEIKNAYALQSKKCNPEENPEEFQRLYQAYKSAINYAKYNQNRENKLENNNNELSVSDTNNKSNNDDSEQQNELKERIYRKNQERYENKNEEIEEDLELRKTFEEIRSDDRENYIAIQNMISEIDKYLNKNKRKLKKVVGSDEFYRLMHLQKFQFALSTYLNSRQSTYSDYAGQIYKNCMKYINEDKENNYLIESLRLFFQKYFNIKNPSSKRQNLITICGVLGVLLGIIAGIISGENGDYNNIMEQNRITAENELISLYQDVKITYDTPEGYEINFWADAIKDWKKDDVTIHIILERQNPIAYYNNMKEMDKVFGNYELPEYTERIIGNRTVLYVEDPKFEDGKITGTFKDYWTPVNENYILIVNSLQDIPMDALESIFTFKAEEIANSLSVITINEIENIKSNQLE